MSFRREKYLPRGGPDGGDGGRGGHVIARVDSQLSTLIDLRYKREVQAQNGRPGEGNDRSGADGSDQILRLPPGTQILNAEGTLLFDLTEAGEEVVLAKGGRGGRGNAFFATPSRRSPDFAQPGEEGEEFELQLSLKVLADVALVGFPNAGKSTLIRTMSRAKPRVADFPFTTLRPHLGVVSVGDDCSYVMADMPGLIEGAAEGAGLGLQFLKHIERAKVFVFLLTLNYEEGQSIAGDYHRLRRELGAYQPELLERPHLIAISQCDRVDVREAIPEALKALEGPVYAFSSFSREGLDDLSDAICLCLRGKNADYDEW